MDMLDKYDLEELKKAQDDAENKKAYLNAAGSVFQNFANRPSAYEMLYDKQLPKANVAGTFSQLANTVQDPFAQKQKAMEYVKGQREQKLAEDQDALTAELKDPNSNKSKALRALAPRWGVNVTPEMSAFDVQQLIDPKKMMETEAQSRVNFENQKAIHQMDNEAQLKKFQQELTLRKMDKATEKAEKLAEDQKKRMTTYGVARTEDDAKKLKEASEIKADMDNKVQELIDLRQKYGAETWDREAVARGQQLSKDLLLQKKQLAGLGVLSKTDMELVDKIIPSDPLQWNWSQLAGQDPTMQALKKFKTDTNKEFGEKLKSRLENYTPKREVAKKEVNKKTGDVRLTYSDGTQEIIPSTAGQ